MYMCIYKHTHTHTHTHKHTHTHLIYSVFYWMAGLHSEVKYVAYYALGLSLFQMLFHDYGCMLGSMFKVCCSVLQRVAVYRSVLQFLQCAAVISCSTTTAAY